MVWAYQKAIPNTIYMVWYMQPPIYKGAYHTEYMYHTKCLYRMQQTKDNMTHDRLQQELYQYIWNTYPQTRGNCWHTPNEFIPDTFIQQQCKRICGDKIPSFLVQIFELYKKHFVSSLSKRKAIGVLKGVTDLVLYYNGILLMMDIKLPGDSLSDAQKAFIAANEKQGGIFIEINTLAQAKLDIDNFFKHSLTTKR